LVATLQRAVLPDELLRSLSIPIVLIGVQDKKMHVVGEETGRSEVADSFQTTSACASNRYHIVVHSLPPNSSSYLLNVSSLIFGPGQSAYRPEKVPCVQIRFAT
jgi:hypothetical protein